MDRSYYLGLAASGLRMPIGTDLALHETPDPAAVMLDGERLGQVMIAAARRWRTPLALSLMDLTLEKDLILHRAGIPAAEREQYHFSAAPGPDLLAAFAGARAADTTPRMQANLGALRRVVCGPDLIPVGMTIGPFSLMTKLLSDPITPIYLAGSGTSAADDPEVRMVEVTLELACRVIAGSLAAQAAAGARAIVVAEPAANVAYVSPHQLTGPGDIFDRYAMAPNRRIAQRIADLGMDLVFHCCGELTDAMVERFASLRPMVLSLGSSRRLWEDARLVPKDVVLFGNLPSKRFYSDELVTLDDVRRMSRELLARMRTAGHPFILGSECDVLSVPGARERIMAKVLAMLDVEA